MKRGIPIHFFARTNGEQGSVLVLVAISMVILIGIVGLAMDVGQMFVARQQVQAAADAAAQAGIMDMYNGTNSSGGATYGSSHLCGAADNWTPCKYASLNGRSSDTVHIDFPTSAPAWGAACSTPAGGNNSPNYICVTVQRPIVTTLIRVLVGTSPTVAATAAATVTQGPAPLPIVVTHPTRSGVLSTGGGSSITICGGPSRGLQVNSTSATAISNPSVDLSKAGPGSNGLCTDTQLFGADFRNRGGPTAKPSGINLGNNGYYVEPASQIPDPLASVNPPAKPANAPAKAALADGVSGCPNPSQKACSLYSPGTYPSGIDIKSETAVFKPGIYYITSGGFTGDSNGYVVMATGFTDGGTGTNTGWTGNMLVYNTGTGVFSFGSNFCKNGGCFMQGSPSSSAYEGILFFQDRAAAAATHDFSGGGSVVLTGTMYLTNTLAIMTANPAQFQTLSFGGHSGSSTTVHGEVIASALTLGGSSSLVMTLSSALTPNVTQVALVQ